MKLFRAILGAFAAFSFLTLVSVQAFHSHKVDQAPSKMECSVCKLSGRSHSAFNPPETSAPELISSAAEIFRVPRPSLQFVFASHGLSPPLA
jgi:hypothetical protein